MAPALAQEADAQVARWLADIEIMLEKAESLEAFREQLLARYNDLPADDLVTVMSAALAVIELRGRAEVMSGR
jgi:phage gp29-like protein